MNDFNNVVSQQFHNKQQEALGYFFEELPKTMVLYGSVRSGKTYVLVALFMMLVAMNKNKAKMYLISGRNQGSIWRNVIGDIEKILGKDIKLDRSNCFDLFGNKILVLEGGAKGTNMKLRGNTLSGALLNETTTLYDEFIQECQNRLSDNVKFCGWMICDTNPDSKQSYIYQNYVLKDGSKLKSGRVNVKCFKFTIWDNPFIDEEYVEALIESSPEGHMFERMINGNWCNSAGMIFREFEEDKHVLNSITDHYDSYQDFEDDVDYYIGSQDFGFEHYGVALLAAKTYSGKYYIIRSALARHEQFDFYGNKFLEWQEEVGRKFVIYADHARPDGISYLEDMGLDVEKANKSVIDGITTTCSSFKNDKIYFLWDALGELGKKQLNQYEWMASRDGVTKDAPKKEDDDYPDALRYLVHSDIMEHVDGNRLTVPGVMNFMM